MDVYKYIYQRESRCGNIDTIGYLPISFILRPYRKPSDYSRTIHRKPPNTWFINNGS